MKKEIEKGEFIICKPDNNAIKLLLDAAKIIFNALETSQQMKMIHKQLTAHNEN